MTESRRPPPRPPREGLEGHQYRAIGFGIIIGAMFVPVMLLLSFLIGLSGWNMLLLVLGGALAAGVTVTVVSIVVADRAGDAAQALYAPSGKSTPYQRVFSYQDAMSMRGDVAGALESFEALIAELPGDAAVRFAAAALYAGRGKDPERAAALYREARLLPEATAATELAATNALIDLYRGALGDDGRARAELRRLAERFAGSAPGEMARRALAEMEPSAPRAAS